MQAKANRGILYVDEVNLLDDGLVDVVLDSAASGLNTVEREGVSIIHPAKFIMLGSGNPMVGPHVVMHYITYAPGYMHSESHNAGMLVTMLLLPLQSLPSLQHQLSAWQADASICAKACLMVLPVTLALAVVLTAVSSHLAGLNPAPAHVRSGGCCIITAIPA